MNNAFKVVKSHFKDHKLDKESFYTVRDGICQIVRSCYDDITVVIYFDDVLDDPLEMKVGDGNNRLVISIRQGHISLSWAKKTWSKLFFDAREKVTDFATQVLNHFISLLPLPQIEGVPQLALSFR